MRLMRMIKPMQPARLMRRPRTPTNFRARQRAGAALPLGAWLTIAAALLLSLGGTVALAQYALDFNTRIDTRVSGSRSDGRAFARRNTYNPSRTTYATRAPYTINRNTGTYTYNPNMAFGRSYYRPTGYNYAGGSYAYHRRVRTR